MSTSPKRVEPPKADDTWLSPKNDISHLMTNMTPDKRVEWEKEFDEQFSLPLTQASEGGGYEAREYIKIFIRNLLTRHHQDLMSEKAYLGTVYGIDIYADTKDEVKVKQINKYLEEAGKALIESPNHYKI